MDSTITNAESLPALYRAILDAVAELERRGRRPLAISIRSDAARLYSGRWDDAGRRGLERLHARAWRELGDVDARPRRPGRAAGSRLLGWRRPA